MGTFVDLKEQNEDLCVEFEALTYDDTALSEQRREIRGMVSDTEKIIAANSARLDTLNREIDRLTNHADGIDYMVAVASGIIAGLIDSFFVGEFSFERANTWGNDKVNRFVTKVAKSQGYKGDDLSGAIKSLEDKFPIAADKATSAFGGGRQHHLRDFSHHPTPVGLFFSLLTQFTGRVYGTNTAGVFMSYELSGADLVLVGKDGFCETVLSCVSERAESEIEVGENILSIPGKFFSAALGTAVGDVNRFFYSRIQLKCI